MDSQDKINNEYKKAFNLGYELAKELNLKLPMFKNKNLNNSPSNAIEDGMLQYVGEASLLKMNVDKLMNQGGKKNSGKGLTP